MDWQRRIARPGAPAIPIYVRGLRRTFWVPPRYRTVAAAAFDGQAFTVRGMAGRTGYSPTGAWHALRAMERMGLGRLATARGWNGRTRFRLARDASVQPSPSTSYGPSSATGGSSRVSEPGPGRAWAWTRTRASGLERLSGLDAWREVGRLLGARP